MGPPSYMRSVVDRNVIMQCVTVLWTEKRFCGSVSLLNIGITRKVGMCQRMSQYSQESIPSVMQLAYRIPVTNKM